MTVNDASVTSANILTRNGVIHVIDKVLVPNDRCRERERPR